MFYNREGKFEWVMDGDDLLDSLHLYRVFHDLWTLLQEVIS